MVLDERFLDAHMSDRIESFGVSARALWGSPHAVTNEKARFDALSYSLPFNSFGSLLDVGCGFGRLRDYLREKGWSGSYTGVEASAEVFERIPDPQDGQFIHGEVHSASKQRFDLTVALGIFNHTNTFIEPERGFVETVGAMWEKTRHVLVVDFLCPESEYRSEIAIHREYSDVLHLFSAYSRRWSVIHDYLPFEYMVIVDR